MSEFEQNAPDFEAVQDTSVENPVEEIAADAPDTSEPVVETDEVKAERLVKEKQIREKRNRDAVNRRFSEMTRERKAAEQRAQLAEEQARKLQDALLGRQQAPQQVPQNQAPQRAQFASYEDYLGAVAEHKAEVRAAQAFQRFVQQGQEQSQRQASQHLEAQLDQAWSSRASEYAASNPEFLEDIANSPVDIPNETLKMIKADPQGHIIAHALAQEPRLAGLFNQYSGNPLMQARVFGQMVAAIPSSQTSKAPAPGRPVGTRPASGSAPPEDPVAYMKWAKNQKMK